MESCLLVIVSWAPLTEHLTIDLFRSLFGIVEVWLTPPLPTRKMSTHGRDVDADIDLVFSKTQRHPTSFIVVT